MSLEVTGTLEKIYQLNQVSEKFAKQEFVIKTDNQYNPFVLFQCKQQYTDQLNRFEVGQEVKVFFNLEGRKWENPKTGEIKYFNTLNCWKLELLQALAEPPKEETNNSINNDELPF